MIFVVALGAEKADGAENHLQVVIVEAETSSEALIKAIELSPLEDTTTAKVIADFDNIEDCKDNIIADIKTPYVHVDVC